MSSYETMLFSRDHGVARITLNRPTAGNALSPKMCRELADVVTRVDVDKSVGALVIDANGKLFCAGGDLAVQPTDPDALERSFREYSGLLHIAIARLVRLPVPVIVAVQGVAAGAGMSIACAGDLVLVAESARFTLAYTKAGLVPDGGASWLLPRLIGLRRAQELAFTNRMLTAAEAVDWGLGTRLVRDADLAAEATALAKQIVGGPSGAYAAVKRLFSESSTSGLETHMEKESREIARAAASADGREGMLAFREKRPPNFGA